jgi:hypothetical protein
MAELVDVAIMEVVHAAIGIQFDADQGAKDRLRLPARLKGGRIRSMTDLRRPAFLGAILDVLPRCIDIIGSYEERTDGIYNKFLAEAIGRGAYDLNGVRNARFLTTTDVGPYPKAMQDAWSHARLDASHNVGLILLSTTDEWGKLGSHAMETPVGIKNRGATERIRGKVVEDDIDRHSKERTEGRHRGHGASRVPGYATTSANHKDEVRPTSQERREAMAQAIAEVEAEGTMDHFADVEDAREYERHAGMRQDTGL